MNCIKKTLPAVLQLFGFHFRVSKMLHICLSVQEASIPEGTDMRRSAQRGVMVISQLLFIDVLEPVILLMKLTLFFCVLHLVFWYCHQSECCCQYHLNVQKGASGPIYLNIDKSQSKEVRDVSCLIFIFFHNTQWVFYFQAVSVLFVQHAHWTARIVI